MLEINKIDCADGVSIFTSQITDNLSDLAPLFGGNAETVINAAQRRFRSPRRLAERLTVDAMISAIIGPGAALCHTESGKPYIQHADINEKDADISIKDTDLSIKDTDINVSISHSRTHAALLLCNRPHCGVDIELPSSRILKLERRIALPEEIPADISNYDENKRILWLTLLWTIKEAVYKSVENQSDFDILTDICATSFHCDDLINNKLQKNIVKVAIKDKSAGIGDYNLDVASMRLGDSILSYVAY